MTRSLSGAETQSWIASSGPEETSSVSRFLTVPLTLRQVQEWQIPIRQPDCGWTPASSACSRTEAPLLRTSTLGAGEADRALAGLADGEQAGRDEALDVEPLLEAVGLPVGAHGIEQGGRAAGEGLGVGEAGIGLRKVGRAEVAVELAGAGRPRVGADQPEVGVLGREPVELLAVDRALGVRARTGSARSVPVCPSAKRVRRIPISGVMPLPAPIRRIESGRGSGRWKSPSACERPSTMPGAGVVGEEVRDQPLGVALDRDLQLAAGALGGGGRVAAGVADAVDLDRDLDELAGAEALPDAVGAQGQGDALLGAALGRERPRPGTRR